MLDSVESNGVNPRVGVKGDRAPYVSAARGPMASVAPSTGARVSLNSGRCEQLPPHPGG